MGYYHHYFYPYKDRINGIKRKQSIFLSKIPLKLENTTDEIFISESITNTEYKIAACVKNMENDFKKIPNKLKDLIHKDENMPKPNTTEPSA